jgi:hypothetical protein
MAVYYYFALQERTLITGIASAAVARHIGQ